MENAIALICSAIFFAIPSSDNCPIPKTADVNPLPFLLTSINLKNTFLSSKNKISRFSSCISSEFNKHKPLIISYNCFLLLPLISTELPSDKYFISMRYPTNLSFLGFLFPYLAIHNFSLNESSSLLSLLSFNILSLLSAFVSL